MKTLSTWNVGSVVGRIMMGLVLAAMIGSINVAPVLGKDDRKDMGKHDNGRYEQRGHGYDRDRHVQGRRDKRPYGHYGHRERDYYPPPRVIYAPPPPPGVGIFFPPVIIHR